MTIRFVLAGACAALTFLPATARAENGLFYYCYGVASCGMGGASIATASGPEDALRNPASLAFSRPGYSIGGGLYLPRRGFTGGTGPLTNPGLAPGDEVESRGDVYPRGTIALSRRITPNLTFGLSGSDWGGGVTDYKVSRSAPGAAGNFDTEAMILVGTLNASLAYRATETLSFGASLVVGTQYLDTDFITKAFTAPENAGEGSTVMGIGLRAGLMYQEGPVSLGAYAASPIWFQEHGKYDDLLSGPIDVPAQLGVGMAYAFTPTTRVAADVSYTFYEDTEILGGQTVDGGFGWEDQWAIALGLEHDLSEKFTVRGGYNYSPSQIPDENSFANALAPTITEHVVSAGFSWRPDGTPDREFSFAASWAPETSQTDPGDGNAFSAAGNDTEIFMEEVQLLVGFTRRF
ncbi:Outer membrane protein transport protein (OMPP1/FadL/TodX) [Roseivivax jejudonensis]|uniref:Outer membrane protein transport protein (OMPP1/FadL/TodX) n=1 Tax=Roseivivax jejudonensis TaxID=1529041 RepID=A0A1X7A5Y5_9RHOB|nr:outer membrane protein transport protein [Roseivivax jejudonensis]SLN71507.1 Outer membrane protein transport protein (OMPP1/FadL/TodX) [Roseivivax jejudonensis]